MENSNLEDQLESDPNVENIGDTDQGYENGQEFSVCSSCNLSYLVQHLDQDGVCPQCLTQQTQAYSQAYGGHFTPQDYGQSGTQHYEPEHTQGLVMDESDKAEFEEFSEQYLTRPNQVYTEQAMSKGGMVEEESPQDEEEGSDPINQDEEPNSTEENEEDQSNGSNQQEVSDEMEGSGDLTIQEMDKDDPSRDKEDGDSNREKEEERSPIRTYADDRKKKKPTTEGSNFATKINVGFNHQVPFTPAFFLDHSYTPSNQTTFKGQEWARLMYSPYQMEKIRRRKLKEGSDSVVKNEFELAEFIQMCAKSWKNNPGWHPFSPEFAYKILHFADYDPNKALKFMNDPSFNFSCVCDPPVRRYDNKWKPKDRRGQVPTNPYPPPVTLRGYLLRRHTFNK